MNHKAFILFFFIGIQIQVWSQSTLYFPPTGTDEWETIDPASLNWCASNIETLDEFLVSNNTKAFLVLKDGKVVLEHYFDEFKQDDTWYWASAGKSLTAFLTGLAQEDGLLDIHDSTIDYLGSGWTDCGNAEDEITIYHQLTMSTGLDYTMGDLDCTEPACLNCLNDPGQEWYYHNAPYTLISRVIEAATGLNYNVYTFQKLNAITGINGLWVQTGLNRIFFSTPRNMARFGLLMLGKGNWEDTPILSDSMYFTNMITPSQNINPAYGYLWWLNGQESFRLPGSTITFQGSLIPNAPDDAYAALGKNGQILLVIPSQNMVVVRMGDAPDGSLVPATLVRDIWDQIEALPCTTSAHEVHHIPEIKIYPNPSEDILHIETDVTIIQIKIIDQMGRSVLKTTSKFINIDTLPNGSYVLMINTHEGELTKVFIKQ